jgi:hypothetical protein
MDLKDYLKWVGIGIVLFLTQTVGAQSTQPTVDQLREYNSVNRQEPIAVRYEETRFYAGLHASIFKQRSVANDPTGTILTNPTSSYPTLHGITLGYEILPRTYLETGVSLMDYQSVFVFADNSWTVRTIDLGAAYRIPLRVRYQLLKLGKKNRLRLAVLGGTILENSWAQYKKGYAQLVTGPPLTTSTAEYITEIKGGSHFLLEAGAEIEFKVSSQVAVHLRWSEAWAFSDVLINRIQYEQNNQVYHGQVTSKGSGSAWSVGLRFYLW